MSFLRGSSFFSKKLPPLFESGGEEQKLLPVLPGEPEHHLRSHLLDPFHRQPLGEQAGRVVAVVPENLLRVVAVQAEEIHLAVIRDPKRVLHDFFFQDEGFVVAPLVKHTMNELS